MTGRMMSEFWGRVHFWGSFIFMNLIFQPMFAQGMAGMLRRMADGGANYSQAKAPGLIGGLPYPFSPLHPYIPYFPLRIRPSHIPFIFHPRLSIKNSDERTSSKPP